MHAAARVDWNQCPRARVRYGRAIVRRAHQVHPILREILLEPVGWLAIGGSLVMFGLGIALAVFIRRKIRSGGRGD